MTNLKKNIDHYMDRKGIKMYSHLLLAIANQLGIRGQKAYQFAENEKSNFSKMLKGNRPLKTEFIIPLEKIFGISLARLLDEDAYKLPANKEEVPFIKGFRYYAYKDDPQLYKTELVELLTFNGNNSFCNTDEYGKTFLDYIVEYSAVNGIRFLYDYYHIKLKWYNNQFMIEPEGIMWTYSENAIEFARLVASMNDAELFNDIYDTCNMFFSNGFYSQEIIYENPDFIEIILDHEDIFKTIFENKKYEFKYGSVSKRKYKKDSETFCLINPIINGALNYALNHLDKYFEQAKEILEFGIKHNEYIKRTLALSDYYHLNELSGVFNDKNEFIDVAVITKVEITNNEEINKLLKQLPRFKYNC